jgi:hypothetical protein
VRSAPGPFFFFFPPNSDQVQRLLAGFLAKPSIKFASIAVQSHNRFLNLPFRFGDAEAGPG